MSQYIEDIRMSYDRIRKCCFCDKYFYNSTFLMKHIHRRHPETNLSSHQNQRNAEKSSFKVTFSNQKSIVNFFCKEFFKFREELEIIKKFILKEDKTALFCIEAIKQRNFEREHSPSVAELNDQKNKLVCCKDELLKLGEELDHVKKFIFEQNKVSQFSQEIIETKDTLITCEPTFAEDRVDTNSIICDKLDNFLVNFRDSQKLISQLLSELKSINSNSLAENMSMWQEYILNLNDKFEKLESLMAHKIKEENHISQKCENQLDNEILRILKSSKTKKRRQRSRINSIERCGSSPNMLETAVVETNASASNDLPLTHEERHQSNNVQVFQSILEDKLNTLNVSSEAQSLSNEDFEKKMRLVQLESEELSRKHKSFSEDRQNLSLLADEKAKDKIVDKNHKKVRFQDASQNVPPAEENDVESNAAESSLKENCFPDQNSSCDEFDQIESQQCSKDTSEQNQNSSASFKLIPHPKFPREKNGTFSPISLPDLSPEDKVLSDSD